MNTNLLDLNNDILEIIGDYVKKYNERRISKEVDFETTYSLCLNFNSLFFVQDIYDHVKPNIRY